TRRTRSLKKPTSTPTRRTPSTHTSSTERRGGTLTPQGNSSSFSERGPENSSGYYDQGVPSLCSAQTSTSPTCGTPSQKQAWNPSVSSLGGNPTPSPSTANT